MKLWHFSFIYLIELAGIVSGAKILLFFAGGTFSHKNSVWPYVCSLADHGHEVTYLSSYGKIPHKCAGAERIKDIVPEALVKFMAKSYGVNRLEERQKGRENEIWDRYHEVSLAFCKIILSKEDPQLHQLIYKESFDLVVVNAVYGDCGLLVASNYGAKYILSDSSLMLPWYYDTYGFAPPDISWIPELAGKFAGPSLSFIDRIENMFHSLQTAYLRNAYLHPQLEELMKQAFNMKTVPSFLDIERNASIVFVNSHHSLDFPRTLPPNFINIGGLHCWNPPNELSQGYQTYLDDAKNGAVLIAFGSTIDMSNIPDYFLTRFFDMMRHFESIKFIWRWEGPLPKDVPSNLKVSKWLPQREILNHPNLRAFISHAGLNSIIEATYHGVPIITMPLFADQDFNAYRIQAHEVGIRVEAKDLGKMTLINSLRTILDNPKYKKKMMDLSKMFKDRPMSPIDSAVYWTEFVIRNDDLWSLRPSNSHQNWIERRSIDVYFLFFSTFLLALSIPVIFLFCFIKKLKKMVNNKVKSD